MEREKEEAMKKLEKEREETEKGQREEKERAEKERKKHIERTDFEEKNENEERERKMEKEKKVEVTSSTPTQHKQEVTYNQSDVWPPLREAELDDIAFDDNLQGDEESDPKLFRKTDPKTGVRMGSDKDNLPLRSATKGKLKSGAMPVWLREEEDEEVEYETGQEQLGSVWLAELYMEGEAG